MNVPLGSTSVVPKILGSVMNCLADLICRLAVALLAARDSDTVCYERKKASENWEKL
ncbi:hypothetical protein DEO72_LG11g1200 [Vigna unguiculata]|uniref:Uncharacterized protein n=1 Tax=Vigna unguiculata TaxID=3917 RepID=A0A4D6NMQ9_VIGUN|nr:hypothetical protein DEO72_LG11g1200 [Vigna unguiculata]